MCAPVALGVASFATGALGAYGQYQSGQAQAAAANAATRSNYKYQLKMRERNWDRERAVYGQKVHQFDRQVTENSMAANRAYAAEQRRLNEVYKQAAFSQQGQLQKLLNQQGQMAARGDTTGKSASRVDNSGLAQYGRNLAIRSESLQSARQRMLSVNEETRRSLISENNRLYGNVAIAPQLGVAPPTPTMQQGPSKFSLLTGLGSSALSGYQSYNDANRYEGQLP